jgi:hypothetical protein
MSPQFRKNFGIKKIVRNIYCHMLL